MVGSRYPREVEIAATYYSISGGHANTLFANHTTRIILRIEPHGASQDELSASGYIDDVLQKFLKQDKIYKDYKYVHAGADECPIKGLQYYVATSKNVAGSCVFLSHLLTLLKIVCLDENMSLSKISHKLRKRYGDKGIEKVVLAWINFNWVYITKNGIRDAFTLLAQSGLGAGPDGTQMQLWFTTADWTPFFQRLASHLGFTLDVRM